LRCVNCALPCLTTWARRACVSTGRLVAFRPEHPAIEPKRQGHLMASGTEQPEERRALIALGSNLGDRWAYLRLGLEHLQDVVAVSPVYETQPVGGPPQGAYLNMVVELRTKCSPRELLRVARAAEAAAGRVRAERWGPRTLDVDILLVGDEEVNARDLTVPHPRMWERGFVLVPLNDLAPELTAGRLREEHRQGVRAVGDIRSGSPS